MAARRQYLAMPLVPLWGGGFMIWQVSRGSSCLWDFSGRSGSVSGICTQAMLTGACLGAWYYSEDFLSNRTNPVSIWDKIFIHFR